MAKLLVIIICVCTTCIQLAWAQMARKDLAQPHTWSETVRHDTELRRSDRLHPVRTDSDLEYANQMNPIHYSDFIKTNIKSDLGNELNSEENKLRRNKRHAGHSHGSANNKQQQFVELNQDEFIKKLFNRFTKGDREGDRETMNLNEFEDMVRELHLDRLINGDQLAHATHTKGSSSAGDSHEHHSHDAHSVEMVSESSLIGFGNIQTNRHIHSFFFHLLYSMSLFNSARQACL